MLTFFKKDEVLLRKNYTQIAQLNAYLDLKKPIEICADTPPPPPVSTLARLFGSALTGALLEPVFQPIDTSVKRMQTDTGRYDTLNASFLSKIERAKKIIFKEAYSKSFFEKVATLYQGIGYSINYSIIQRTYKFGGQPVFSAKLDDWFGDYASPYIGNGNAKVVQEATAGTMIGAGEIMFLPFDNIKVKRQTSNLQAGFGPLVKMVKMEKLALYNGWGAMLLRNVPGSLTLFGASAVVHHHVFQLKNCRDATFSQNFIASVVGAIACVVVTNPADVIKVRSQAAFGIGSVSTFSMIAQTYKTEGFSAFAKGLRLRMLVAVPKITAVKTGADFMSKKIEGLFFSPKKDKTLVATGTNKIVIKP